MSDPRATVNPVQLTAIIQRPGTEESNTIQSDEADDYDTAKADLEAKMPHGWRMLSIRRW